MHTRNVIAVPPSYNKDETLDLGRVLKYVHYLVGRKATTLMTTVGTSQFNLMTINEIHKLNEVVSQVNCIKILGVPPCASTEVVKFVERAKEYVDMANLIVLYPDRFYDYKSIYNYLSRIREASRRPLYLHTMPMKNGRGGEWNFKSDIVSTLFEKEIICGIKEEHSQLQASYDFIRKLPSDMDIIVAGGSMRRHQFLRSAGANSFLAGVGNFFPEIESKYCDEINAGRLGDKQIALESKLFDVFLKYGWHPSLRIGLACLGLLSYNNRMPWPEVDKGAITDIKNVLLEVANEK